MAGRRVSLLMAVPLCAVLLAVVAGVWPSFFGWITEPAASSLMTMFHGLSTGVLAHRSSMP